MIDNASSALYNLNQDPFYEEIDYLCAAKSSNGFIGIDSLFYALIKYKKHRDNNRSKRKTENYWQNIFTTATSGKGRSRTNCKC